MWLAAYLYLFIIYKAFGHRLCSQRCAFIVSLQWNRAHPIKTYNFYNNHNFYIWSPKSWTVGYIFDKHAHKDGVGQTPIPLCYVFFGRWSSSFSSHPSQAAVRWAGLAMLPAGWQSLARGLRSGCALMNCRHDAGRQPARRTTKRPSGPISVYLCEGEIVKTALTT